MGALVYGDRLDWEWGPWCTETGWTQPWIAGAFALRQENTSLWEMLRKVDLRKPFERLRPQMLPDDALQLREPPKTAHAALGKAVRLAATPDPRYLGFWAGSLADGVLGPASHSGPEWMGFLGTDFEAVIDLGSPTKILRLELHCLQSTGVGVFLPKQVEFAVSKDGTQFQLVKKVETPPLTGHAPPQIKTIAAEGLDAEAQYIRVRAANPGPLPEWVVRGSVPSWLFVDEILVNPGEKRK